ncbi:MAG: Signal transduction response regulator Disease resistance protein Tetratricopeptide [Caulobacteraceae bacterium]|nr:Signal transduction response regulator Disease resistance protein Tetratricopeptide [Caulobacteraceae bacterium]
MDLPARDEVRLFGPFRLRLSERLLERDGAVVSLGGRALDLLLALTARPGEVLSNQELADQVWPQMFVDYARLRFHVTTLRKALGDGVDGARYITNVPGRGYCFVSPMARPLPPHGPHNLPAKLTRLIGRSGVVADLVRQLTEHRLLALVGPGGIGKTAVALKVAEELISSYEHGVWLIDLARVADPELVPSAMASVLKLEVKSDAPVSALAEALRERYMLLVFDNCEHVIEAAVALASAILSASDGIRILATSREPLRVEGEHVHRLAPLPGPPPSVPLTTAEALAYPAIELFVERAAASLDTFVLDDADAMSAGAICRKLDGLPLAIEFAAARIDAFGVLGLAALLDERLPLRAAGRRTADPRHRTLGAVLDWSYRLLSEGEKSTLRLLAAFAGPFTLEAANAVAGRDVADDVFELASKSLISADTGDAESRFRLLETTRAFAVERLDEDAEVDLIRRSHALYFLQLLRRFCNPDPKAQNNPLAIRGEIDDIRAALNWALSARGDKSLAVDLVAASAPLWTAMSLLAECRDWMVKGLAAIGAGAPATSQELVIRATRAMAVMFTRGMTAEVYANWEETAAVARKLDQPELEAEAVMFMWAHEVRHPNIAEALKHCRRYNGLAMALATPSALALASYMLGNTLTCMGSVAEAHTCLIRSLEIDRPEASKAYLARYGFCRRIDARNLLTFSLWQSGFPDEALHLAAETLLEAEATGYPIPLNIAIARDGYVRLWAGRPAAEIEPIVGDLMSRGEKFRASEFIGLAKGLSAALALRRGDAETAASLFEGALDGIISAGIGTFRPYFIGGLAMSLGLAGHADRGLAAIKVFEDTWPNSRYLFLAELLRVKAELFALQGPGSVSQAQQVFSSALGIARSDGALFWELRTATSYAQFLRNLGRWDEARALLSATLDQFRSSCECGDISEARRLLGEL